MLAAAAGLGLSVAAGSCLDIPSYVCTGDTQCIAEGVAGACDFQSGICIYANQACPTFHSDAKGNCMPPANQGMGTAGDGVDDGVDDGADDGVDDGVDDGPDDGNPDDNDPDDNGPDDGPMTTMGMESTDDGMETGDSDTGSTLPCEGATLSNITAEGLVSASSVFNGDFVAINSVDSDLSTSWFSSGPGAGDPSIFDWAAGQDVCITTVVFTGNGMHENVSFQTGFGFESLEVIIYDGADTEVWTSGAIDLSGTPDPGQMIDVGGVTGRRVSLELTEHEDTSCGGFSEMQVLGAL